MSVASKAPEDLVGRVVLGRFRVLRHLADGGMGAIYLARNEGAAGFIRPVVIKCILPHRIGDPELVSMFVREARIMATLRHPGIVSIIDFAEEDRMQLMIMEYVHGFHLGRWNRFVKQQRERFPVELAIYIALHVLRALDYAHTLTAANGSALNIVHRDVTPSNVLLSVDGHVKLADFGIARTSQEHTDVGASMIKGKFPYLAPEILQGDDPSAASDVYSVGLILHELLVGKNEFREKDPAATVARVISHLPTPVDKIRDVPSGLADVIAKSLAKLPESRYTSASEMAEALSKVRELSEDEGARRLRERISADFCEPEMAKLFKLPELNSLEADWTTPAGHDVVPDASLGGAEAVPVSRGRVAGRGTDAGSAGADAMTEVLTPGSGSLSGLVPAQLAAGRAVPAASAASSADSAAPAALGERAARSRSIPVLIGLAIVAAAAVAIVALLLPRGGGNDSEQPVIVVSDRVKTRDLSPATAPAALPDASVNATPTPPNKHPKQATKSAPKQVPKQATKSPSKLSTAAKLTRAFAKQAKKLERCFVTHALSVQGAPSLSLRIRAELDGSVSRAEVIPAEISKTPLGACLIGVAKAVKLGAQPKAVTFRVPIRAQMR